MYTVKPQFVGSKVNFQGKLVQLTAEINQAEAKKMVNAGLGRYFEGNPAAVKNHEKVVLKVVKKGGKGDEIEEALKTPSTNKASDNKNYTQWKNDALLAEIEKRGIQLGDAKKKDDYVALLVKNDQEQEA